MLLHCVVLGIKKVILCDFEFNFFPPHHGSSRLVQVIISQRVKAIFIHFEVYHRWQV